MFNLLALASEDRGSQYADGVRLALDLCEGIAGQFKLVETPMNSFLLVTNVMPEDGRPWQEHLEAPKLDFSCVRLPKLRQLDSLLYFNGTDKSLEHPHPCPPPIKPYLVYDEPAWRAALTVNKDAIISDAITTLSDPEHWEGVVPEDPLACLWLLYYGNQSFCAASDCLYLSRFNRPAPILLPPHLYRPCESPTSFIRHACQFVKFLYHGRTDPLGDAPCPFDRARILSALENLRPVSATEAYLARLCLVCHLYKQNSAHAKGLSDPCGCVILGGAGEKYITSPLRVERDCATGDACLYPAYDLARLLGDLDADGAAR